MTIFPLPPTQTKRSAWVCHLEDSLAGVMLLPRPLQDESVQQQLPHMYHSQTCIGAGLLDRGPTLAPALHHFLQPLHIHCASWQASQQGHHFLPNTHIATCPERKKRGKKGVCLWAMTTEASRQSQKHADGLSRKDWLLPQSLTLCLVPERAACSAQSQWQKPFCCMALPLEW